VVGEVWKRTCDQVGLRPWFHFEFVRFQTEGGMGEAWGVFKVASLMVSHSIAECQEKIGFGG